MSAARRSPDHRQTARSACSLAMALIQGRSVTPMDFEREHRADRAPDDQPRSAEARRAALRNACSYLEDCGFTIVKDPKRRGAMRLDRRATLAPKKALAKLDDEQEILEDLAHVLVALADAFEDANAVEAHGAAAKLLRDFALNGLRRELAPATTRNQRLLRDAMAESLVVRVTYRREDGKLIKRTLEPLRHVYAEGQDFLVAVDRRDSKAKTFHYDRFAEVEVTDERFLPRPLDLGCLFNPPFAYMVDHGPDAKSEPAEVTFRIPVERERAVRDELRRLLCEGCGRWEDKATSDVSGGDDGHRGACSCRLWIVHGEDPAKAASFALRLGIEVVSPTAYRDAYLEAIAAARRAFGMDVDDASTDSARPSGAASSPSPSGSPSRIRPNVPDEPDNPDSSYSSDETGGSR